MDAFSNPQAAQAGHSGNGAGTLVKDSSTAEFKQDVIDTSMHTPVLVDFWAPWCGPCRQLGPAIERVVSEQGGKVRLVKINVDENQQLAGQMGVQSIPAVFAFAGGRPVDGFLGAVPESEIRRFVQGVIDKAPAGQAPEAGGIEEEIAAALEAADEALEAGDLARASEIYGAVLQHAPDNAKAMLGLARTQLKAGNIDQARQALSMIPEDAKTLDGYQSVAQAIALADQAAGLGGVEELEQRLLKDPNDHQARYDLALVLSADGFKLEAVEALCKLMRLDRDWNEGAARKKLLEMFEAWGPKDQATVKGRRMMSAVLFS
ncbi:MAG TPA: thioredoxin [Devosiaceae bacterium]